MRLAIIIGHNKISKGAKGVDPIKEHEYDFNSKFAIDLYRYARSNLLDCKIFDKSGTINGEVYDLVNKYLDQDIGCSIELHFNAANGKAQGTETLYVRDEDKEFATVIQESMCLTLGRKFKTNRGVKQLTPEDRGYKNLVHLVFEGVLIEPAFADNKDDARLLYDKRDKLAQNLTYCVTEYLKKQV
jgi:N-acetylmuramoyl-L-alanine amidase